MLIEPQTSDEAGKLYAEYQERWRTGIVQFYEKIAFYSAGTISLTITFMGFAYLQQGDLLQATVCLSFLCFQKYYLLAIAWIMLLWSLFGGVYMTRFIPQNISL